MNNTPVISVRNPGIDLVRSLSMFFVICLHILGQGGLMEHAVPGSWKYCALSLCQILVYCAVDIYGITTGYLLCKKAFRLSRLTKLWLTTVFWSVAVSCGFFAFMPETRTIREAISMFLPILRGRYWFFTAYFVVVLVSPVLNLVIHNLSRRQFLLLFAALFLIFGVIPVGSLGYDVMRISGGNHFSWMIALYLIGGFLRVHGLPEKKPAVYLAGYFLFAIAQLFYKLSMEMLGLGSWRDLFLTCVSPLVVGEAVCLFLCFRQLGEQLPASRFREGFLNFVTPGIYSVYIIHVHPLVFWNGDLIAAFRSWDTWNMLCTVGAATGLALAVFTGCILLDTLRQGLFRLLRIDRTAEKLSSSIETKIRVLLK